MKRKMKKKKQKNHMTSKKRKRNKRKQVLPRRNQRKKWSKKLNIKRKRKVKTKMGMKINIKRNLKLRKKRNYPNRTKLILTISQELIQHLRLAQYQIQILLEEQISEIWVDPLRICNKTSLVNKIKMKMKKTTIQDGQPWICSQIQMVTKKRSTHQILLILL